MPMHTLHPSTFDIIEPTEAQIATMSKVRTALAECSSDLDSLLPPGADKTYALRHLREVVFWAFEAVIRHADGTPR